MRKNLILFNFLFISFFIKVQAVSIAENSRITGENVLDIDVSAVYSIDNNDGVLSYQWIPPIGCKITEGQGLESVTIRTSYLSQKSELKAIRQFANNKDTLSLVVDFYRPISIIKDHKIAPGESIELAGENRNTADIYYEYGKDENQRDLITAHRLTVEPKAGKYMKMTKPYLQTVTSNSVWISWKTDYESGSKVVFGTNDTSLTESAEGSFDKLTDSYYWHSVKVTGLQPNTLYSYKVTSDDMESDVYRFKTAPDIGSKAPLRILLMGDHQIKTRSGYEWLMQAAKRKIEEKYGNIEDNISMIMNVGDQVDVGTLDQYEHIHLFKSELLSPWLPIMTAVGNHETYNDPGMKNYATHFHYEELEYQGVSSGTENYYAYQIGRVLFVVLSTEHTGTEQKNWVKQIVNAAKTDDNVDFIISTNHRPIQAEQYIGDISSWARNEIVPILAETDKHVFNYGGHHHLYHRGQWPDAPFYHIINGGASWDQMWGMSSEKDYDDVQKTIDYWGYQIIEFDFDKKEMQVECYAIGNKELVVDNILIDKYHRTIGKAAPDKPAINNLEENQTIALPFTFEGTEYSSASDEEFNTSQFQIATTPDFSNVAMNIIRDVENLYGSSEKPFHIPVDINEGLDVKGLTVGMNKLKNGEHYVRVRYRDQNLEWSLWSDTRKFIVEGSIDGDPAIYVDKKSYALNENVQIRYEFVPEGRKAWIGIYPNGKNPGPENPSITWSYTDKVSGNLDFSLNEINEYYAVLFEDEGYKEASPRIPFFVGEIPQIETEKTSFEEGEAVKITYSGAPGLKDDWIGIYRMGTNPGKEYSNSWKYTEAGSKEGEISLSTGTGNAGKLSKGYYFVSYFTRGAYFEPGERQYISVGEDISSLSVDKNEFTPDEDIIVKYANGPGTPKDWVGLYKEGEIVGIDELDGFYYTYGATDGEIVIPSGEIETGDYFLSLFINDSYDEVSPRIHISIKNTTSIEISETSEFNVYPVPVKDILTIESNDSQSSTISIVNLNGISILEKRVEDTKTQIDVSKLVPGCYILNIKTDKDKQSRIITKE